MHINALEPKDAFIEIRTYYTKLNNNTELHLNRKIFIEVTNKFGYQ